MIIAFSFQFENIHAWKRYLCVVIGCALTGFMDYSTLPGKIKVLPISVVDIIYTVYKACNGKRQR